jgi:hypothetical protein
MAYTNLKNEFLAKLQASKSFHKLKTEEQSQLLKAYENTDDATYTAALKELAEADADATRFEAIKTQKLEEQVVLTKEIKEASRVMKKTNLEESEQKEQGQSMDDADALLKQIGADKSEKKRKKIFGIF